MRGESMNGFETDFTRDSLLEKILDHYSSCYDITRPGEEELPLVATADFHEQQTGYVLIRKAEMWSADRHEYAFFYSVPKLTVDIFNELIAKTRALGEPKVNPESGHMSSNIVAIFLCDSADEAAVKALRKYHYRKSFRFSFLGWMELHTALVDLSSGEAFSNGAGRNNAKFLRSLLKSRAKKLAKA